MANQKNTDFHIPFTVESQLCSELNIQSLNGIPTISSARGKNRLPGQPSVSLSVSDVHDYLGMEFVTPKLNRMAPHLWLLATPSSSHISPLHAQLVRGRTITICEDPDLHLVWLDHRVFIKPIPKYLLSFAFWKYYLDTSGPESVAIDQKSQLVQSVRGYMRSYFFLVRHESDYRVAVQNHLIPEHFSFEAFMDFISGFGKIQDNQVSQRYHFGELRLSRLNAWARILLRRPHFHKVAWQYADMFARRYVPYLFAFTIFSVMLSAMQVGVSAKAEWTSFLSVSAWFSVLTLGLTCLIVIAFTFELGLLAGREIIYTFRQKFFCKMKLSDESDKAGKDTA